LSSLQLATRLPEDQRFLAPNNRVGMSRSKGIKLWHSHLLLTRKYSDFCQQRYGRFIHDVPYLQSMLTSDGEVPETPRPACVEKAWNCDGNPHHSQDQQVHTADHFARLYQNAFETSPPIVWNVEHADAIAA
jgi:hypothetical protein